MNMKMIGYRKTRIPITINSKNTINEKSNGNDIL